MGRLPGAPTDETEARNKILSQAMLLGRQHKMNNTPRYRFHLWLMNLIASLIPEGARRQVLYDLRERVADRKNERDGVEVNYWGVTFEELYAELRD